jgi:hypothetical protein
MEQNHAAGRLNTKNTMDDYNNNNPSITWLLLHKQPIKIYHKNIRSLSKIQDEWASVIWVMTLVISCV